MEESLLVTNPVAFWAIIAGLGVLLAALFWLMFWLMRRQRRAYLSFWSRTTPCPHCLGFGRIPKGDWTWTDESVASFQKQVDAENVPDPFKKAFRE